MAGKLRRVGVGLCADLAPPQGGLDLEAIGGALDSDPDLEVEVVQDLRQRPEQVRELASRARAQGLVLGLSGRPAGAHEFQGWARKAGIDPCAIELVDLSRQADGGEASASRDATLLLRAAVARLRAFEGSEPEQLRIRFLGEGRALSRRSLVSLPPWTYEALPTIDSASCLGRERCGRCVAACPFEAVRTRAGGLFVDSERCQTCGLCMAACPARAIDWPGSWLPQYEAQVAALLAGERPKLAFTCRRAAAALDGRGDAEGVLSADWLPVEVPCMATVTPGWMLQALAGGAEAVALVGCGGHCRVDQQPVAQARAAYVRELIALLGVDRPAERVRLLFADGGGPEQSPVAGQPAGGAAAGAPQPAASLQQPLNFAEPTATAEAVLRLAAGNGPAASGPPLEHPASPLGVVEVREETCTSCGACATACPTHALRFEHAALTSDLSFDATRCVACRRCVEACPEQAHDTLTMRTATDPQALSRGRVALKRELVALCKACGRPVAPAAMLERVGALLEDESDGLVQFLGDYCADCRGLAPGSRC